MARIIINQAIVERVKEWPDGGVTVTVKEVYSKADGSTGASWYDVKHWPGKPSEGDVFRIEGNSNKPRAWNSKDGTTQAQNVMWAFKVEPVGYEGPNEVDPPMADDDIPF